MSTSAGATGAGILGQWQMDPADMVIELASCGEAVCGRLVGLPDPAARDVHNPDPALADRPLCRLNVLDVTEVAGGWQGSFYNPADGTIYNVDLQLGPDGRLQIQGTTGLPMLARIIPLVTVWSPVLAPGEPCAVPPVS